MADSAVAEIDGVRGCDHDFASIGNGQRDKVICAMAERGRERSGHSPNQPLQVGVRDAGFTPCGVMNSVRRLTYVDLSGDLFRGDEFDLCAR